MNNPPAFPHAAYKTNKPLTATSWHEGMTLRDYFAAAVVPAIYAQVFKTAETSTLGADYIASCSYIMADAMLKAREQ